MKREMTDGDEAQGMANAAELYEGRGKSGKKRGKRKAKRQSRRKGRR